MTIVNDTTILNAVILQEINLKYLLNRKILHGTAKAVLKTGVTSAKLLYVEVAKLYVICAQNPTI